MAAKEHKKKGEEKAYLNPPRLTVAEVQQIYGPNPQAEARERELARTAMRSIRQQKIEYNRGIRGRREEG